MKKSVLMMAFVAFLMSMNSNAQEQEPTQKKKEIAKKECAVEGKKCCAGEEKKGCGSEGRGKKAARKEKKQS